MSNLGNLGVTDCLTLGKQLVLPTETVSVTGGTGLLAGPIFVGQPAPAVFTAARQTALLNIVPSPTSVPGGNALNISADGLGTLPYPGNGLTVNALQHLITCNLTSGITMNSASVTILTPTFNFFANEVHVGTVSQSGAKAETGAKADAGARVEASVAAENANLTVAGTLTAAEVVNAFTTLSATYSIAQQALSLAGKGFDIPHPTKEDHRLRYICLEGPEVGAYIRGTLKDSDTIELPDYWRTLCKPETITVNLTPIGRYQELYVEEIVEWGTKIKVRNASGSSVHCHYTVFAERVTHDQLQVEYKGLTPDDYPGDNREYAIGGWDYARHKGESKS